MKITIVKLVVTLGRKLRPGGVAAELISLLYIIVVATIASCTGISYLLFPEMGALSHDVLTRRWGKWASEPLKLVATPALAGIVGTIATRHLHYGIAGILLIVFCTLLIITLLRSTVAPAMSAGVLPLVLGITGWWYPLAIFSGLTVLAGMLVVWRKVEKKPMVDLVQANTLDIDDALESRPSTLPWLFAFIPFVTIVGVIAQVTDLRFILFPPLIAMAYEMFAHPEASPWTGRSLSFPVACFLTAFGGLIAVKILPVVPLAAGASMAWSIIVLRLFNIHMPPALAVGLIPLVMHAPDLRYPLSVAAGTVALTAASFVWRRIALPAQTQPD